MDREPLGRPFSRRKVPDVLQRCDDLPLGRGHVFEHGLAEACLDLLAGHPNLPRHAARLGEYVRRHRTQPKGREVSRLPIGSRIPDRDAQSQAGARDGLARRSRGARSCADAGCDLG
jgi:hypothetical protein